MPTKRKATLTHLSPDGHPAMVDVSDKAITAREASAECRVHFPPEVAAQLRASNLRSGRHPRHGDSWCHLGDSWPWTGRRPTDASRTNTGLHCDLWPRCTR